jgi:hypothetical protein
MTWGILRSPPKADQRGDAAGLDREHARRDLDPVAEHHDAEHDARDRLARRDGG